MDRTNGGEWPDPVQSHLTNPTDDLDADVPHVPHPLVAHPDRRTVPANIAPEHRVAWVRISELINSGAGLMAGRGIDFEAELARRLRHPVEVAGRAIRDRSASLPPLAAFGPRQPNADRESISRS